MSGIHFNLHSHFKNQTLTQATYNEAEKAMESVGGWWTTIIFLAVITWTASAVKAESTKFFTFFAYATMFSMIFSAPINALISRYLADHLFVGNYESLTLVTTGALITGLIGSFILNLGMAVMFSSQLFHICILYALICSSITGLWITNNVMAILRKEKIAFLAYLTGYTCGFIVYLATRNINDLEALMASITVSVSFAVFYQFGYVLKGFNRGKIVSSYRFMRKKEGYITALAFFTFSMGVWIDKAMFWFFHPESYRYDAFFCYSIYDYPFFVAFTVFSIAHLVIFRNIDLLLIEPYRRFTTSLSGNSPYAYLSESKIKLIQGYQTILNYIIYLYGPLILMVSFCHSTFAQYMPWKNPFMFHNILFGTLFFSIFSVNYIMLQYLKADRLLLLSCFLLFAVNLGVTYWAIVFKEPMFFGTGFLFSTMISGMFSTYMVHRILGRWDYLIFKEASNVI